jgi:pyrroloquinoline quinone biosynthesis protein B
LACPLKKSLSLTLMKKSNKLFCGTYNLFKVFVILLILVSCNQKGETGKNTREVSTIEAKQDGMVLFILGNVQDGGSPHIACSKDCCRDLFQNPDKNRKVVSLGIVDYDNEKNYIIEATPDFPEQMKMLKQQSGFSEKETPDGILLTHAHIGHYTGLMFLGKEAMYSNAVPVYAMPRMKSFLEQNGPWGQLVANNNISIKEMKHAEEIQLTSNLQVVPLLVPHRDEYSETVGFVITGPNKKVLFIPDIDKWDKWETDIIDAISKVDYAFIDGTFFDGEEINNRDISEIPHPFIIESMKRFENLPEKEKKKIHFIHFNHTNPALDPDSKATQQIIENGFNIARMMDSFSL